MIIFKVPPVIPTNVLGLVIMFFVGTFGLMAQTLLTMGFQRETAARGSLAMFTAVVFAVMLEFIVFQTTPTPLSIAGMVIIISTAIYVSLTKQTVSRPATDSGVERGSLVTPATDSDR